MESFYGKMAQGLDLTDSQIEEAEKRYQALGDHLNAEDSPIAQFKPEVYPQGSFRLGTMIRPILEDDEYDVDLVCRLMLAASNISQDKLKQLVGNRIKEKEYYDRILEEKRRCWTLNYSEETKFHLDVLPAIPDPSRKEVFESYLSENLFDHAILMTDQEVGTYRVVSTENWPKTNPIGYAEWFKDRMGKKFLNSRQILAEKLNKEIESIPDWKVKTPLQRAIQILKRHRDVMFRNDNDELKPISIILTTLAANSYQEEADVAQTISGVLARMDSFIETRYSKELEKNIKWVGNPINRDENFADKWLEDENKEKAFYAWLESARMDFKYFGTNSPSLVQERLKAVFGERKVEEVFNEIGLKETLKESKKPSGWFKVYLAPHLEIPGWPEHFSPGDYLHLGAYYHKEREVFRSPIISGTKLPKNCQIRFAASTNVKRPYQVHWQVVNTGNEAEGRNQLRGDVFASPTKGKGGLVRSEYSEYQGTHGTRCFIVKNGLCVAKSDFFYIEIE